MNSADWHMGSWKKHGNPSSIQAVQLPNCDSLIGNALRNSFLSDYVEKFPCLTYGSCGLFVQTWQTGLSLDNSFELCFKRGKWQDSVSGNGHFQPKGYICLNQSQPFPFDPMDEVSKVVVSLLENGVLCDAL
ncbi:unnamed protein product [Urochloa humidicola]